MERSALHLSRVRQYQTNPRGDYHPASSEGTATIVTTQESQQETTLPLHV
jgi:hypothetical protein